ncbi:MAG: 50S ribosomal protein L21 [Planctomycetota bacterium]|nr:50S ribosomal protein L21 [Planctomycetota bacterium]
MYAIISDRNQQSTVRVGDVVTCDLMDGAEPGSSITFENVLLIGNEGTVQIGTPMLDGANVKGEVIGETKGKKLVIFRFRRRKNIRRKTGHRQHYTQVRITEISA